VPLKICLILRSARSASRGRNDALHLAEAVFGFLTARKPGMTRKGIRDSTRADTALGSLYARVLLPWPPHGPPERTLPDRSPRDVSRCRPLAELMPGFSPRCAKHDAVGTEKQEDRGSVGGHPECIGSAEGEPPPYNRAACRIR